MVIKRWLGDNGTTQLSNGECVNKNGKRVEAYGSVDELNSFLGIVKAEITDVELQGILKEIQQELFVMGSDLATPLVVEQVQRISRVQVQRIEEMIAHVESKIPTIANFVYAGGDLVAARLHYARALCRRVERSVIALESEEQVNHEIVLYLNRLSYGLFVLSRFVNCRNGRTEEFWKGRKQKEF